MLRRTLLKIETKVVLNLCLRGVTSPWHPPQNIWQRRTVAKRRQISPDEPFCGVFIFTQTVQLFPPSSLFLYPSVPFHESGPARCSYLFKGSLFLHLSALMDIPGAHNHVRHGELMKSLRIKKFSNIFAQADYLKSNKCCLTDSWHFSTFAFFFCS